MASLPVHPEPIMAMGACVKPVATQAKIRAQSPPRPARPVLSDLVNEHVLGTRETDACRGESCHASGGVAAAVRRVKCATNFSCGDSMGGSRSHSGSEASAFTPREAAHDHAHAGPADASSPGDLLACMTGAADACVVTSVLDVRSGELHVKHRSRVAEAGVADVQVRQDGRVFAVGGWDGRARVYHVRTGKPLAVLRYHRATVAAIAFDEHSACIASASRDSTVAVWDVPFAPVKPPPVC